MMGICNKYTFMYLTITALEMTQCCWEDVLVQAHESQSVFAVCFYSWLKEFLIVKLTRVSESIVGHELNAPKRTYTYHQTEHSVERSTLHIITDISTYRTRMISKECVFDFIVQVDPQHCIQDACLCLWVMGLQYMKACYVSGALFALSSATRERGKNREMGTKRTLWRAVPFLVLWRSPGDWILLLWFSLTPRWSCTGWGETLTSVCAAVLCLSSIYLSLYSALSVDHVSRRSRIETFLWGFPNHLD